MNPPPHPRRGAASLIAVLFVAMLMATFAMAGLRVTGSALAAQNGRRAALASRYAAEAGLCAAVFSLRSGGGADLGSEDAPVAFGGGSYWVAATPLEDELVQVVAAGRHGLLETRLEVVLRLGAAPLPHPAVFAAEGLTLDSNARVDSYDAAVGSYESQAENHNGELYANENGTVASNGSIVLSQNASVHGDATPGPGGTVTVLGNAVVSGATLPAEEPISLPPIEVPEAASTGDLLVDGGAAVTLPPGVHGFDRLRQSSNSTLVVTGPATLVVQDFELASGARFLVDTAAGDVAVYVANDFLLGSNTVARPLSWRPTELAFYLSADNVTDPGVEIDLDETAFESNAQLYGTVYAPNAFIDIDSNFQLFGSLTALRVHLDSNARVHFDEQLAAGGGDGVDLQVLEWRVLSRRVAPPAPEA